MKHVHFFLVFFFFYTVASGQGYDGSSNPMKKNLLSISGSFEGELKFFYERILYRNHALEIGVGQKWSNTTNTEMDYNSEGFLGNQHPPRFYQGYLFSAAYKYYLSERVHPWYFSVIFLYKTYSHPTITIDYLDGDVETRKGSKEVRAGKMLFGKRFNFPMGDKVSAVLDLNFGFGMREKKYIDAIEYSYDGSNEHYYDPAKIEAKSHVVPSLDLGVKLGIGF